MSEDKLTEAVGKGVLSVLGVSIAAPIAYAILLPFSIINAWSLTVLYAWFILPLFPAMPAISVAPMLGIMLFKSTLWNRPVSSSDSKTKRTWSWSGATNLLYGPVAVVCAYPVHWWIS